MADAAQFQSSNTLHSSAGRNAVERFHFTGTGKEYFGIWIVNILLTIVTLGIYSAWAKVRRTRYFYDNAQLAGASFDYHANPVSILKGRAIALVLLLGYQFGFKFSPMLGLVIFLAFMAVMPWLVWASLRFKLYNSSYRGIRFHFGGGVGHAYLVWLVMPIIALITVYLTWPLAHQRIKKFQHDESRFGATRFSFDASVGDFYKIYLIGFGITLAGIVVIGLLFSGAFAAIMAAGGLKKAGLPALINFLFFLGAIYLWLIVVIPLFITLSQNLIWSKTRIGAHQFHSEMKWTRLTLIVLTNLLGIVFTLGLFAPFAKIRLLKYRLESISLVPASSLDEFFADEQSSASAVGEGMADLLDFDISL